MPTAYKVLGQSSPAATTEATLYTVPSLTSTVVSSIVICNQAASSATFRVAVRPSADETTAAKHYIVYGVTLAANDSIVLTIGVTMAAGDKIQIFGSSATLSYTAYGSEIS